MSLMVDSLNFLSITKAGMGWDRKRARENSQDAIPRIQGMVSAWIGIAGVEIEKGMSSTPLLQTYCCHHPLLMDHRSIIIILVPLGPLFNKCSCLMKHLHLYHHVAWF